MFKFGFSEENSIKDVNNTQNETISWFSSKEIFPIDIPSDVSDTVEFACNDVHLKQVSASSVLNLLENKGTELAVINANQNHSDLLTAIYEGGLKVWECTIDLINYLNLNEINFSGKKVLDLGCGAGLVGIFTLSKGSICYFQDYNEEVVQYVTIPNVKLNVKDISSCKFFSGDWQSFTELLTEKSQFDYILTSETIYNTKNYDKLHNVFKQLLKKNGTIYLAAKSYYFGVGGSVSQFQDFLIKNDTFDSNYCWKCTEGVQREILQIKFKE